MDVTKLPIEEITWEDHFSQEAWQSAAEFDLNDELFVSTVGYRLKETKTKVVLLQNVATNGQVSCTMTILKKTIKSRKMIREAQ